MKAEIERLKGIAEDARKNGWSQLLEFAGQDDQLDLTSLAWAVAAVRPIAVIEWAFQEKVKEAETTAGDQVTVQEMSALSGTTRAGDVLMIAPSLLNHVRTQVEVDVSVMRSVPNAREERDLRRRGHKG